MDKRMVTKPRRRLALALAAFLLPVITVPRPAAAQTGWQGSASIGVAVLDKAGTPVGGATVTLHRGSELGGPGPAPLRTDREGHAAFSGLADGDWVLEVSHPDYMAYRAYLEAKTGKEAKSTFAAQVATNQSFSPMRVSLYKVRGPAGTPVTPPAPAPQAVLIPAPTPPPAPPVPAPVAPIQQPAPPASPPAAPAVSTPAPPVSVPAAKPVAPPPASPVPSSAPPAPPTTPRPEPTAVAPAPTAQPAPRPAPPPAAARVPVPPATPQPAPVPSPPKAPPVSAVQTPAPPAPPPLAPPAPVAPVVPAAAPPPPVSAGGAVRSATRGNCPECKAGESALSVDTIAGPAAAAGACTPELRAAAATALKRANAALPAGTPAGAFADGSGFGLGLAPDANAALQSALSGVLAANAPCRLLAVTLPTGSKYLGYRYDASDAGGAADCMQGQDCPIGHCGFAEHAAIERGANASLVWVLFENREPTRARRAELVVYYRAAGGATP